MGCLLFLSCAKAEPLQREFNLRIIDGVLVEGTSPLKVNQGDMVTMNIEADEHVLFHLHGYAIEKEIKPGNIGRIVLTATATGSFPFTIHTEHGRTTHEHSEPSNECEASLPADTPTPEIDLVIANGDEDGLLNVTIELKNFILSDHSIDTEGMAVGHWHLFVDSKLVGMYATEKVTVGIPKPGSYEFKAILSALDHCEYGISISKEFYVNTGQMGNVKSMNAEFEEVELGRLEAKALSRRIV